MMQTQETPRASSFRRSARRERDRLDALGVGLALGLGSFPGLPSQPQPTDPSQIAGGPVHWWRDTVVGSPVTSWTDKAATGTINLADASNGPATSASDADFGGNRSLTANGTSSVLTGGVASDWNFLHNGLGVTCLVVYRWTGAATGSGILFDTCNNTGTNVGASLVHDATNGRLRWFVGNGGTTVVSTNPPASAANGVTHWAVCRYLEGRAGNEYSQIVDNVSVTSGNSTNAPTASSPLGTLTCFKNTGNTSNRFSGKIAELVFWNSYISDAAVTQLRDYVTRYGL